MNKHVCYTATNTPSPQRCYETKLFSNILTADLIYIQQKQKCNTARYNPGRWGVKSHYANCLYNFVT